MEISSWEETTMVNREDFLMKIHTSESPWVTGSHPEKTETFLFWGRTRSSEDYKYISAVQEHLHKYI